MTKHQAITLDTTGHSTTTWDPNVPAEVEAAEEHFDTMIDKGYRAFHIEGSSGQGRRMDRFDPAAAKVMFVPQLRGG
jgi:hypothetical protein